MSTEIHFGRSSVTEWMDVEHAAYRFRGANGWPGTVRKSWRASHRSLPRWVSEDQNFDIGQEMEPKNMRRWRHRSEQYTGELLTCARPGRSKGKHVTISDSIVHQWVKGLPGTTNLAIVSLLGRKNGPAGRPGVGCFALSNKQWCRGDGTQPYRVQALLLLDDLAATVSREPAPPTTSSRRLSEPRWTGCWRAG